MHFLSSSIRSSVLTLAAAGALTVTAGCSSNDSSQPGPTSPGVEPTHFVVTIENVSAIYEFLASGVQAVPVGANEPGPLLPGDSYEIFFHAGPGQKLSFALMFVHSNDWFFAPSEEGIELFDDEGMPRSGDVSAELALWDAGTEHDQDPGVGTDQAPHQSGPDQGMADSNSQVRLVSDPDGELPAVADVVQATLMPGEDNLFVLRLENVSTDQTLTLPDQSTTAVPLAPVVWVLHSSSSPLFSAELADRGEGLEALAEDGNPEPLAMALSERSGVTSPLAPGIFAVHRPGTVLFRDGSTDRGAGLEALAEDGDPSVLEASLASHELVAELGVFSTPIGAEAPGPLMPGQSYRFELDAEPGQLLSFATMLVQSNDLFFAPSDGGIPLFGDDGVALIGDITMNVMLWNAGTEIDQAPGAGPDQAPRQSGPDTGAAESGAVEPVQDQAWPAPEQVLRVSIAAE